MWHSYKYTTNQTPLLDIVGYGKSWVLFVVSKVGFSQLHKQLIFTFHSQHYRRKQQNYTISVIDTEIDTDR